MTEHPLERTWNVWLSSRVKKGPPPAQRGGKPRGSSATDVKPASEDAFTEPKVSRGFSNIAEYWTTMNNLPAPSKTLVDINYYIFSNGVKPSWEHPENAKGGRWTFHFEAKDAAAADAAWLAVHMALVGETLDPAFEVTGIALAKRRGYTRISVWTRDREDAVNVMRIGRVLKEIVPDPRLEYQDHGEAFKTYRHIL